MALPVLETDLCLSLSSRTAATFSAADGSIIAISRCKEREFGISPYSGYFVEQSLFGGSRPSNTALSNNTRCNGYSTFLFFVVDKTRCCYSSSIIWNFNDDLFAINEANLVGKKEGNDGFKKNAPPMEQILSAGPPPAVSLDRAADSRVSDTAGTGETEEEEERGSQIRWTPHPLHLHMVQK